MKEFTKDKKIPVDLLKPVDIKYLQSKRSLMGECYGTEFDIFDKSCSICHDNATCGILYKDFLAKKIKEKGVNNTYLDTVDFTDVNNMAEKIAETIRESEKSKKPMRVDALYKFISKKAKIVDKVAIIEWIRRFIIKHEFEVKTTNKKTYLYATK
jgi:hypothetical protein